MKGLSLNFAENLLNQNLFSAFKHQGTNINWLSLVDLELLKQCPLLIVHFGYSFHGNHIQA